jgi:acetyl-CoA carboxylase carboxyl transferase subunit alpha
MAETDFEAPLVELQKQIDELAKWPGDPAKDREARRLRDELDAQRREVYANLTPWQKTLVARHPNRPYTLDYVHALFTEWTELHGDRRYADDPALVCGFALYHDCRSASSDTRRAATPSRRSTATSGCPSRRATARRCA